MQKTLPILPPLLAALLFVVGKAGTADSLQECAPTTACPEHEACVENQCQAPPLYIFLFTHGEDHINHTLSEERFTRLLPEVAVLAEAYPELRVSWTLQFMGADSESMFLRHEAGETDVVNIIRKGMDQGIVHIGYHGAHEPTYDNNALSLLPENATWDEVEEAGWAFLNLGKDPTRGGVDPTRSGGARLVREVFGPITVVSGYGDDSAEIEAMHDLIPNVPMFGFPDHGPNDDADYASALRSLMRKLSPRPETPGGLFWMDGALRINDGNPVDKVNSIRLDEPPDRVERNLEKLNEDRVQVINAHLGSKYIYAEVSPTEYAYDNPDAPELPDALLWGTEIRENKYATSLKNMNMVIQETLLPRAHARFVSPGELQELFVDETGTAIPWTRIQILAESLAASSEPLPGYVEAEGYYYTLAEAWYLLEQALTHYASHQTLPESVVLSRVHGPLSDSSRASKVVELDTASLLATIAQHGEGHATSPQWVPDGLTVGAVTLNPGEYLLALASLLAAAQAGELPATLAVAPCSPHSNLHDGLMSLQTFRFPGVSWTLKPARHR